MAKVSFTKLGLNKNQEIKILKWNDQEIEIKQYLPVADLIDLATLIVNKAHDEDSNFSNPIRVEVYTTLEILFKYTNINFTDKQKEDVLKLYDLVVSSGLYNEIIKLIPEEEYNKLIITVEKTINAVYAYQNSVLGILDTISEDYSSLDFDATSIQSKLADPNNLEFLKSVLTKLG